MYFSFSASKVPGIVERWKKKTYPLFKCYELSFRQIHVFYEHKEINQRLDSSTTCYKR